MATAGPVGAIARAFSGAALVLLLATAAQGAPERIVSLAPQLTEIMFALGLEERLVAVTTYCDYPPTARQKPNVGGMSNPSLEAIVGFRPDMVLLTTDGNPREVEERLTGLGIPTFVFRARRINELPEAVREMGRAIGESFLADGLADSLEKELSAFDAKRRERLRKREGPPLRVLFVIWPEPLVVAGPGTAVDDALELLGLDNLAAKTGLPYPKYSVEEVLTGNPDLLFVGKMNKKVQMVPDRFLERIGSTAAARHGRILYTGDSLYRLGPRIIDGIRELESMAYGPQ